MTLYFLTKDNFGDSRLDKIMDDWTKLEILEGKAPNPNDLFLDQKHRQYSCAYFTNENESLEDAQQNKINHIIKK